MAEGEAEEGEGAPGISWDKKIEQDWSALEYAPEEYKADREKVLLCIKQCGLAIQYADPLILLEDKALVLEAVATSYGDALKWSPKHFLSDPEFMEEAIKRAHQSLKYAPTTASNDAGAMMRLDRHDRKFYCGRVADADGMPLHTGKCDPRKGESCESCVRFAATGQTILRQDPDYLIKVLEHTWMPLLHADEELRGDKEVVIKAVEKGGMALKYASKDLQNDIDVARAAVKQTWQALQFVSEKLRNDKDLIELGMQQDWHALFLAARKLWASKHLGLLAVETSWLALTHIDPILRADREIAFSAVTQDWHAFEHVSEDLRADKELTLIAVRQHGCALAIASEELRADKEVVLEAMRQDVRAIEHASAALRGDKDVMLEGVNMQGGALQFTMETINCDPDLVAAASTQKWHALEYAVMPEFPDHNGCSHPHWLSITGTEAFPVFGTKLILASTLP